ncbi:MULTISPECIES: TetR/AcrR family transcriptional regulator [unclassified Streptomyces]|uniref:TetR/AcrR family transcriptional regulator n=1 Tax=unclassified Streptomyces TaxID=2593676 RepID=UPI0013DB6990|nr:MULTISPECIES: TetR/AcrR family transcriptional regulator [unclassified Streptomyces]KAF2775236.1 TetR family transcriptional regulator [Streptomyces sp. OM5714]NHI12027.1 TetR family transcriptional regulator [Streptomyces sp. KO7888]
MSERQPNLRERRRSETRRLVQAHAVRLFTDHGYDAVTVADVAEAAGVSAMTVYRHFPTKEDLVLIDQPAQLVAEHVAASSAAQPLVRRVGSALIEAATNWTGGNGDGQAVNERFLLDCLRLMVSTPALRARHLDSQYALQQAIVDALEDDAIGPDAAFRAQAATSACIAAMHTALTRWVEDDGHTKLPDLIARALTASFGDDAVAARRVD